MEQRQASLSPWVADVRARVAASPEFRKLTQMLFHEVRDGMRQNADKATLVLAPFAELSPAEQIARVREARKQVGQSDEFIRCREAAWRAVDAALDAESEAVLMRRTLAEIPSQSMRKSPVAPDPRLAAALKPPPSLSSAGKVDAVIELAGLGAAELLSRWPLDIELKWEQQPLSWLLNSEIPPPLRRALWRTKLRAWKARAHFLAKLAESPLAIISPRDAEMLQYSQLALQSADPSNLAALSRMRACASYVDSTDAVRFALEQRALAVAEEAEMAEASMANGGGWFRKTTSPREFFWLVPLLRVFPADTCEAAELVERYCALMASAKPHLSSADGKAVVAPAGLDGAKLPLALELISERDSALGTHIERTMGGPKAAKLLLGPHSNRLGVGFFSPAATEFVWDIGLLSGWEHVEHCIAAALLLLRDGLLACTKSDSLSAYMEVSVPQLTVSQLRAALEQQFMPELRRRLRLHSTDDIISIEPSEIVS